MRMTVALAPPAVMPPQARLERAVGQMIVLSYQYKERFGNRLLAALPPDVLENLRGHFLLLAEYAVDDVGRYGKLDLVRVRNVAKVELPAGEYEAFKEFVAGWLNVADPEEPDVVVREIQAALDEVVQERIVKKTAPAPAPEEGKKAIEQPPASTDPRIIVLENMVSRPVADLILDETLTSPEEVFEGLIALGEVTVLGGPPKAMKSWTVKAMGICAASGKPWLGFNAVRPFTVLLLSAEGREVRLRERFKQLIAFTPAEDEGLRRMECLSTGGKLKLDTDAGEETLIRLVKGFEIVILDPYYRFIANGDENSHADQRRIQDVLDRVKALGKCVILVHHVRKGTGVNAGISELRGAGLDGYVDGAIMLTRKKAESSDLFTLDFMLRNFEDPNPMELSREGVVLVPATTTLRPRTNIASREIVQILVDFGGEMRSAELYRQIQELKACSKATAERAVAYASTPPDNPVSWKPVPGTARGRTYFPTETAPAAPVAVQGELVPEMPKKRRKRTPK